MYVMCLYTCRNVCLCVCVCTHVCIHRIALFLWRTLTNTLPHLIIMRIN